MHHLTERLSRWEKNFHAEFTPALEQMPRMGAFGEKYMNRLRQRLCHEIHDSVLNFFGVNAYRPLFVWREKGRSMRDGPRGWFQWHCRCHMNRRYADDTR